MSGEQTHADRLVEALAEEGLERLLVGDLVTPSETTREANANLFWLCGFTGTSGLCLIGGEERIFLTDFRYVERAANEVDESFERLRIETRLVPEVAKRLRGRVGFDDAHASVRTLRELEESAPDAVELVPAGGIVERLRRSKDEEELRRIREAARLTDEVYEWVAERGLVGRSEREVRLAAEQRMRELGAEGPSFPAIVASGPNAAIPHHESSKRQIRAGELVVIDMGSIVEGYCSDCTRTFAAGEPEDGAREVYELVHEAQAGALGAVAAGVAGRDADAVARERIEAAGHGEHFGHGLGHGVGIEVHEAPRLSKRSDDILAAGDVATVEPGIYLPGRFGVRIEDLVAIREDAVDVLSGTSKDLRIVS